MILLRPSIHFANVLPVFLCFDENLALVIGFLAGSIGLAIYLRSLIDLVLPLGLSLVLVKTLGDVGVLGGAVLSALWGYFMVRSSNKRLAP